MAKRFNIPKKIQQLQRTKATLPRVIGNMAKNHFLESWRNEAFSDTSTGSNPWAARKTATKQDRRTGKRRNLLVQSGALRRSVRVGSATWSAIRVGSYGIPYAQRHNRGLDGMPQRQFIGSSAMLNKKIRARLANEIKRII